MQSHQSVIYCVHEHDTPAVEGAPEALCEISSAGDTADPGGMRYCSEPAMDSVMRQLHFSLLHGSPSAQIEIDRRMLACVALDSGWNTDSGLRHVPVEWLFTARSDTVQYSRLPDLTRFMISAITNAATASVVPGNLRSLGLFETLILSALPCLRSGKVAHNVFADRCVCTQQECVACINLMYGTLLGLFPCCSKKPVFPVRKAVFQALHSLAVSPVAVQKAALAAMPYLLKLCVIEYVSNITRDYCPAEFAILSSIKGMDVYFHVCNNMCDSFRMETLQDRDAFSWTRLEASAESATERFLRTCKFRVTKNTDNALFRQMQTRKMLQCWRKHVYANGGRAGFDDSGSVDVLRAALSMPYTTFSGGIRILMMQSIDTAAHADLVVANSIMCSVVETIHANVQCFPLPRNLVINSCTRLLRHRDNPQKMFSVSRVSFCMWCINRNMHTPLECKMRLDVPSNQFFCASCSDGGRHSPPVVTVNLAGRLLRIGNVYYHVCQFCSRVVRWEGTGSEFTGRTCNHGSAAQHRAQRVPKSARICSDQDATVVTQGLSLRKCMLSLLDMHTAVARPAAWANLLCRPLPACSTFFKTTTITQRLQCLMCERRNCVHGVCLLHVPAMRFITVFLCSRHRVFEHIQPYVYDTTSLRAILNSQ